MTPEPSPGRLRPLSAGPIAISFVLGLVGGWLLHPLAEHTTGTAPVITWAQPLVLGLLAAILAGTAWLTYRTVQVHGQRLEPHQAVNRLVLGRACALVGALLAGGYFGYALSWLGAIDELAAQRGWRSVVAGAMGLLVLVGGLLLERACRVRDDHGDAPGPPDAR